jgi:hypothetical protein
MTATCKSCRAPIIWANHSTTGNAMPLDEVITRAGVRFEVTYLGGNATAQQVPTNSGEPGHPSHFGSCPNADKHRRSR